MEIRLILINFKFCEITLLANLHTNQNLQHLHRFMNRFTFLRSLFLAALFFYLLNNPIGKLPPLGKILSPSEGFWQNEKDEVTTGALGLEGLKEPVRIHYDAQLVPHVFAQNDLDLYFAQGYITAKHRLWQMEFQTHAAAGRLSEIFGKKALEHDRMQRRKGMVFGAENTLKDMAADAETIALLDAYTQGINSYINSLDPEDYPVEYKLLNYAPEAWTPLKTSLLLMYMTDMLCGGDADLEYTNALRLFGKKRFDAWYPDFFDTLDPVVPKETSWNHISSTMPTVPNQQTPLDEIAETFEKPHPNNGSNNWAISAEKSYSGNPILANDPHLGLNLPSIWFVMQLATPKHSSYGATLPGALGVISGFNKHIAWGETNATRDVKDWYKIQFQDASKTTYRYEGNWKAARIRVEEIKIKGQASFLDSVRYTHHGPVSYDASFKGRHGKEGYAMKWVGHLGGNGQRTFLELNRGKNYEDYLAALQHWVAPAQNFVFASADGDIALWVQGDFANKWKGQGKFLMDGSLAANDWKAYIPKSDNAFSKNPKRGFVSSANQYPTDQSYPYYVFNDGYESYRNRIINTFLSSKNKLDLEDFKSLQNNNFNLKASELLPTMLAEINRDALNTKELRMLELLASWNYDNGMNALAPSLWTEWWNHLYKLTWDEFEQKDVALKKPFTYQTIYLLKNKPNDTFADIVATTTVETAKDLFLISFQSAMSVFDTWDAKSSYKWSKYKGTAARHLLQGLPAFSRFDIPIGGEENSPNAVTHDHGPSWRMIVEMSSPPKALGIYPGGQSGNPGSVYYDNFIDTWAAGDYFEALFMQSTTDTKHIRSTQTLSPKS